MCIGDTSLRNYMPKHINPTINRNKITCRCETCIIDMLLESDLNKWRLKKLADLKICIPMQHQPLFYKDIRKIIIHTGIKGFQTIHKFIPDTVMLHHPIIVFFQ